MRLQRYEHFLKNANVRTIYLSRYLEKQKKLCTFVVNYCRV